MKKKIMPFVMSGFAGIVNMSEVNSKKVNEAINRAEEAGSIRLEVKNSVVLDSDAVDIILRISEMKTKVQNPVLVITDESIFINDPEILNDILAIPGMTMTSLK